MKRFTLRTKRAQKVLALTLAAALVVPAVPGGLTSAKPQTDEYPWADLPEAIASESFDDASKLNFDGTSGKSIKFTDQKTTQQFFVVSGDGTVTKATFESLDYVPEKDGDKYVYEDINVAPEVVTDDVVTGGALKLKNNVTVAQYPTTVKNDFSIIQEAKTYGSAAEIKNPFTAYRDELYDASRYTMENVAKTATALDAAEKADSDPLNEEWSKLKARYSRPEAKAGVTISFWAKTPIDAKTDTAADTNYLEFHNTKSLVYKSDDLGKNYVANLYKAEKAKLNGADFGKESPFYMGEVAEGTIVSVNKNVPLADLQALGLPESVTAKDLQPSSQEAMATLAAKGYKMKYIANPGMYMKWNPKAAESEAAIAKGVAGQYKVYVVNTVKIQDESNGWEWNGGNKVVVIDSGRRDENGKAIYYHLKWSDTVFSEGAEGSNYSKYVTPDNPTETTKNGALTQVTEGATGLLYMSTRETTYNRDINKTGKVINSANAKDIGTKQNGQHNTNASVYYGDSKNPEELKNAVADEEWHYITLTITDEWFQTYVDGVAIDPSKVSIWNGNTFNQGSSMYKPNGEWGNTQARTDWEKVSSNDIEGSIYGQLFGVTVMDFITDANTKLYAGGIDQKTAAGTQLDSFAFYKEAFNRQQVEAEYAMRKDLADGEEPGPAFMKGDVDHDGDITTDDALWILMKIAGKETEKYHEDTAECDGKPNITTDDALQILMKVAGKPSLLDD